MAMKYVALAIVPGALIVYWNNRGISKSRRTAEHFDQDIESEMAKTDRLERLRMQLIREGQDGGGLLKYEKNLLEDRRENYSNAQMYIKNELKEKRDR